MYTAIRTYTQKVRKQAKKIAILYKNLIDMKCLQVYITP